VNKVDQIARTFNARRAGGMTSEKPHPITPNERLEQMRLAKGWTQQEVADKIYELCVEQGRPKVGINSDTVGRWERGKSHPGKLYGANLRILFNATDEDLGLKATTEDSSNFDMENGEASSPNETFSSFNPIAAGFALNTESDKGVNRREAGKKIASMLVGGGTLFAAAPDTLRTPLWERLSRVLERSSRIDTAGLNGLEQITKDYWKLRTSIGYRSLLHGFSGHLETVIQLLQCPQAPSSRERLCTIASEITQHIGAIYFDMNDYATAQEYYNVSIETAQEAENYTLWAIGLVRMSSLPIYSKRPQEALPLLQAAKRLAVTHSSSTILAWIASMEAEAHANLHDEHACLEVLTQAESLVGQLKREEDPYGIKFDYARFIGYRGVCHLRLQQPEDAISALQEGNNLTTTLSARQRSIIVADSAAAYNQQGEVEEASRLLIQALTMTDRTKSLLATQRILDIRRDMMQWGISQSVKELDNQLALRGILPH
jgi:tetratricopeptide (TPR) repeat protein